MRPGERVTIGGQQQAGVTAEQGLERHSRFEPGKRRAEAVVNAVAEPQVRPVAAADVERVGRREAAGIAVGRAQAHQHLFAGGIREVQNVGEDLQRLWSDALALLGGVRDNGRECLAGGCAIDRFDDFERAVEAIGRAAAEHADRWPWIDAGTLARARADVAAGRFQKGKEVLDALRNPVR